jgi:hypothetical protein
MDSGRQAHALFWAASPALNRASSNQVQGDSQNLALEHYHEGTLSALERQAQAPLQGQVS